MKSIEERKDPAKSTIAIVDDSPLALEMLCSLLEEEGYETRGFASGVEALNSMELLVPDLIVLDIDMPGLDGFEVCSRFKQLPTIADIPVVFISSYTNIEEKVKAFQYGGVDYLTKPIQLEEVSARIRTHLRLRHYQHQLLEKNKALVTALDDLKEAQKKLVQSEKMASLGQLVAGIAHEINNPISFIYANVHALKRYVARFKKYLSGIDRDALGVAQRALHQELRIDELYADLDPLLNSTSEAVERVRDIIEDLRTFSSGQTAGKSVMNLVHTVHTAVRWVIKGARRNVDLEFDLPEALPVIGHPGQLTQVIINLLQNALDAIESNPNPIIKISGGESEGMVWLEVADNGSGISEEELAHIFDPFFTTKPVGKGTGLGLAISYSLVSEHGGTVSADSRPERGTVFRIELPRP